MAWTEEMYWALTEFDAYASIEVTASHISINYIGMKIVKLGSRLSDVADDLQVIKVLGGSEELSSVVLLGKGLDG